MTRVKLIFAAALAALAAGAVASASASAAPCVAETGSWCIGVELAGILVLTESVSLAATAATSQKLSIPTISTVIVCTGIELNAANLLLENKLEPILADEVEIIYTGCTTEGEPSCKVSGGGAEVGKIKTNKLDANISLVNSKDSWKFLPEGTLFVEITVAGCLKAAKIPVSGSQNCNAFDAEETLLEHKLECLATGSELKDGTKEAKYEGTSLESLAGENKGDKIALLENFI